MGQVDPDEYAELRSALDYAELALGSGDAEEAISQSTRVIERLAGRSVHDLLPGAQLVAAQALQSSGRLLEAISALEHVVDGRDQARHWIRGAISLAWCYREHGALGRSVEFGERIAHEFDKAGFSRTDDMVRLQVTLAAAYFERGDVGHAVRVCRRAIELADELESPAAQASAYWNTCIMEYRLGRAHVAIPLAQHAIRLLEAESDTASIASLRSHLGDLFLDLNPPDVEAALGTLTVAARELEWSRAPLTTMGRHEVSMARAHFLHGDIEAAKDLLEHALLATAAGVPTLKAAALVLRGEIRATTGSPAQALDDYRAAVFELTAVGADRRAAQVWYDLGAVLHELGATDDAREAFKQAAAATGRVRPGPRWSRRSL